jgi:glucan phosphoethanolaminetransferase (alkaline phosphatase superfamily)
MVYELCESHEVFKPAHDFKVLLLIIPLSIGLVTANSKLSFLCVGALCIAQLMQFSHLAYFGSLISNHSIHMLIREWADVINESVSVFWRYAYVIPVVLIPFIGIAYIVNCSKNGIKSFVGNIVLIAAICATGVRTYCHHTAISPNLLRFTIDSSLKAFWGCLMGLRNLRVYQPYEVVDVGAKFDEPVTIVYIIGESVNYSHMSLFGYDRDTTPNLKKLAADPTFYYTVGIAGGIVTIASSRSMMNIIREPDNLNARCSSMTNLFKFAKSRGFKTFYLSAQTEHLLASISGVNYIDVLKTKDSNILKAKLLNEDYIFDLLSQQKFSDRNFIVLHQWCLHAPYSYFPSSKQFKGKGDRVDDYDNAMTYNERIITRLFDKFNKQQRGKFYIIWASDHNELLGEDGLYGHCHLVPKAADIPILIQSNDSEFMKRMKDAFRPNHFEIATEIARLLGYEVRNPNEVKDVFYISGADDISDRIEFIRYRKDSENRLLEYLR